MAFHTFGPGLALDKITMKGLSTVTAQLIDAETGDPVQAYTMDDVPAETLVTTNRYGYFPQFKVPDTTRQLRMTFGGLTLENFAWEILEEARQAADDAAAAWAAVEAIMNQVIAIDAPAGFDANSVTGQAIHIVTGLDEAMNTAPAESGSQTILTYPFGSDALQQVAFSYSTAGAEFWSRVKTSGGWSAWIRLDADKWADRLTDQDNRLTSVEQKNTGQDNRLTSVEQKNTGQDNRLTSVEQKNTDQDDRLDGLEDLQPVKTVRLENGKWVWDPAGTPTHYVLIDHEGNPTIRATPWPVPNPTTPEFTW